jgi:hypothetical protein
VKLSIRQVLADSYVAVVAIALFLLWSLDAAFSALWPPVSRAIEFVFTAIAILDIPYFSRTLTLADRAMLIMTLAYLYSSIVSFLAAWLLARWVYGVGPFRILVTYGSKLIRTKHA